MLWLWLPPVSSDLRGSFRTEQKATYPLAGTPGFEPGILGERILPSAMPDLRTYPFLILARAAAGAARRGQEIDPRTHLSTSRKKKEDMRVPGLKR